MPRSNQLLDQPSSMQSGCCDALQTVRNNIYDNTQAIITYIADQL